MSENNSNTLIIKRVLSVQSIIGIASSIVSNPVLPFFYRNSGASIEQLGIITMFNFF